MALADRKPSSSPWLKKCELGRLMESMSDADLSTLSDWMDDTRRFSGTWIAEQISDEFDVVIPAETVRRHRRRTCCEQGHEPR